MRKRQRERERETSRKKSDCVNMQQVEVAFSKAWLPLSYISDSSNAMRYTRFKNEPRGAPWWPFARLARHVRAHTPTSDRTMECNCKMMTTPFKADDRSHKDFKFGFGH